MFVEPEILEALDEEQKQILFIKMREEQVKRWKAYEEEYERQNPVPKKRSDNSRGVQWLTGSDGEVWGWVMGEHKDDLSVEELIEKQELEQARQLAEREMLESIHEDENTLKQQLSRMGVLSLNYPNRVGCGVIIVLLHQPKFSILKNFLLMFIDTDELVKRQSEIFEMIKEKRQKILKEAEGEAERANREWEEQERKAREAEAQIRRIAQKAREQHRQQSLRTSTSILPALKDTNAASLREAIKNLPRPPKPKSRQAIVDWFRVEELSRGTGYDPKTNLPAPWFHGIISREKADELLKNKPSGSFLVRISERIWGYTVSYVVGDGTTKHFLIERIPEGYQFLGTNQVVHRHLFDLITYHETAPITMKGNEILKWAVGQVSSPPDYAELLLDSKTLKQRSNTLPSLLYRRI
uniref:SH2 domain-containing protein n=1 Tax=Syphacia muris TaxID=451379 RepID=A0A0N5AC58_9BILA